MTQYIVTGYARSGTSMMMRCLQLGGIPAYYDETHKVKAGTNKYGSFEVPREESKSPEAYKTRWASMFQHPGKAVKILWPQILYMPKAEAGSYAAIIMTRNPKHIYESYERAWGPGYEMVMNDAKVIREPGSYERIIDSIHERLADRLVSMIGLAYDFVIDHPIAAFTEVKKAGWPIDVQAAAAGVEPEERHFA